MPITERALLKRINRKLADDGEVMRVNRSYNFDPRAARQELGRYFVVSEAGELVSWGITDLEEWARRPEMNVLKPYEALEA